MDEETPLMVEMRTLIINLRNEVNELRKSNAQMSTRIKVYDQLMTLAGLAEKSGLMEIKYDVVFQANELLDRYDKKYTR